MNKRTATTTPTHCNLLHHLLVMLYDAVVVIALLMLAAAAALLVTARNYTAGKDLLYTLYLASFWFMYLTWCWRHGGLTLGMRVWKVRLLPEHGATLGWRQCVLRFFGSLVSALCLGAGFWWSLFDNDRLTWHDRLSRTRLIRKPE